VKVALAYAPTLDAYDLGPGHPFRPERVSLAVAMMRDHGLIAQGALEPIAFETAAQEELLRVHSAAYLDVVGRASGPGGLWPPRAGIGPGDTPAFPGMHDAAALVCGATNAALKAVTDGRSVRAFSPAGGLHHAHRDYASGFCVYNDIAVAVAAALERDPGLRVCYIDIDAHHGDGTQDIFYEEPRVLTISVHESGRHLFPGTGDVNERGYGAGFGSAVNVPMPPLASDECYLRVFDEVVVPATRAFGPQVIVAQCGADAHWSDPLTTLGLTLGGFKALYERITALAGELCGGRLLATGGGGYSWQRVVPQAWTLLAGALTGIELPAVLAEDPDAPIRSPGHTLETVRAVIDALQASGAI
jgi:acetoin utilization protein AcuC